jgi:hypothetical protein
MILCLTRVLKALRIWIKNSMASFSGRVLFFLRVLAQISLVAVLQDEVKVIGSLLDVIQLDDASVVAGSEHFDLILEQFQELPCVVR